MLQAEATTAKPLQRKAHIAQRCEGPKARAAAKKKARRTIDAPSNKMFGNCLLGFHCSQNDPGWKPRRCLISRRCTPPTWKLINSLSTMPCRQAGDKFSACMSYTQTHINELFQGRILLERMIQSSCEPLMFAARSHCLTGRTRTSAAQASARSARSGLIPHCGKTLARGRPVSPT